VIFSNPNHLFDTLWVKPVVPGHYFAVFAFVGYLPEGGVIVLDYANKTFVRVNPDAGVSSRILGRDLK
jgi:hypothetical protein